MASMAVSINKGTKIEAQHIMFLFIGTPNLGQLQEGSYQALWLKMAVLRGFGSISSSPGLEAEWLDLAASIGEAYSIEEAQEFEAKKAQQQARDKKKKNYKEKKKSRKALKSQT